MKKSRTLVLSPEEGLQKEQFDSRARALLGVDDSWVIRPIKRSIDARGSKVKIRVETEAYPIEEVPELITFHKDFPDVSKAKEAIIVGAGPAGLFAAIRLIEKGIKPVIIERGKDVRARRRDIADLNKNHIVNEDSNYCFGEGGAGTYSDGKLYTRSKKRGDLRRVLEILVAHGATENILIDAHPHIGTNKLPKVIEEIRQSILDAGGEIHFNTRVIDFILKDDKMVGVKTAGGDQLLGLGVILATGHSARDIFELLHKRGIDIEAKPYALGVRVEHPQQLIDKIQYHCTNRGSILPAASYALTRQVYVADQQYGVFSFCMCPGGFIVPSATAPGEVVVNGMSPSRRDSQYANSGIVVTVGQEAFRAYETKQALSGVYFQKEIEQKACAVAGGTQAAPAQRLTDFINRKVSSSLPQSSYQPGLTSVDMREVLPDIIADSLRKGFVAFGKQMKGYMTDEAQIVGVESRTSSPVKIPRDKESLEHIRVKGLFPCGEGAGYAGGIISAAMDGERCAEQLVNIYGKRK